tara:strand:+ start:56 stop:271 length:216 start_codon:yes stop_codon:yes gene_type:complete
MENMNLYIIGSIVLLITIFLVYWFVIRDDDTAGDGDDGVGTGSTPGPSGPASTPGSSGPSRTSGPTSTPAA